MNNQTLDKQIQFLIQLKLNSLQRDNISTLKYEQIQECLVKKVWNNNIPNHLYSIANDINNLTIETVVQFIKSNGNDN